MQMRPAIRYLEDPAGHKVAYTIHGAGPNLVLPAWWISHAEKDWEHPSYREFLQTLGKHFRVVRYDRLGVGLSDRDVLSQTLDSEVELLAKVIDTAVDTATTSFFAFSSGSPVAIAYTARNRSRVDKLCIYGGYLAGADISSPEVQAALMALVRAHWGAGSRALADIFLPGESRQEVEAAGRQQRYSASAENAAALLELTYGMDVSKEIANVANDLLIVHRTGDRAIPCDAGRRLASASPKARFVELEGRAHPPWVGDRDSILKLAVEFLTDDVYAGSQRDANSGAAILDIKTRTLVLPSSRAPLTALEFGVMRYLEDNAGSVVTREELLEHVWRTPFSGSNKVDVLIRALRKKLDVYAHCLETVAGHGYMFRRPTE